MCRFESCRGDVRDREEYNAYHRRAQHSQYRNRILMAKEILGNKCVNCGSIENLEFDHIDQTTKLFTITQRWNCRIDRFLEEIKKCVLRCNRCHKDRTSKQKSVEHGGGLTGKRNCRCEKCGPLKNKYNKKYNSLRDRSNS